MSIKQKFIKKVNEFIENYAYLSSHNGVGMTIPYKSLRLVNVYFKTIIPENMDTEHYEYKALVHLFEVNGDNDNLVELVVLEEDAGHHGIFAVENVKIIFELAHGTDVVYKREQVYNDYNISDIFNNYGYFREVFDDVYEGMWRTLEQELKVPGVELHIAQHFYPGVVHVEAVSPFETRLHFSSTATLEIPNTQLLQSISTSLEKPSMLLNPRENK